MSEPQRTRLLGIDWAPLQIPLRRRLEMLAVVLHTLSFSVFPILMVFTLLYILLATSYWWVSLGYITWIIYDVMVLDTSSRGGRQTDWVRKGWWYGYFRDYFPISLIKTAELSPDKNYIMGYHPHGIIGCGAFCNFATDKTDFSGKFPGIRMHVLTLKMNFRTPILRGYALWTGLCDVSKESINWILTKQGMGNACAIVVGGAAEALEARPGNYKLTLLQRMGFIKIALQTGASLVPVFSFGENDLYQQADNPRGSLIRKFQDKFKSIMGFSPPFFYGRGVFNYSFGIIPFRKPVNTVVGAPIDVPHIAEPTREEVAKYHKMYMDALSDLFDDHKTKYGVDKDVHLTFI